MPTPHASTPSCFPDIIKLHHGEPADESQIVVLLDYIDARHDCADFRLVSILRSLYCYHALLSPQITAAMKRTVLGFKYWMDEPGHDSMCYWSENHQLLFAACEYLAGQLYPSETFTNDGSDGATRMNRAAQRLDLWFSSRFLLGFSEWHSNIYYEEDITALSLLIDCAASSTVRRRASALLDLLLLDMALHSYRGLFAAASGRCYESAKQDPRRQNVRDIMTHAFGFTFDKGYDYSRISTDFVLNRSYQVPEILRRIAHDPRPVIIKDSHGLNLDEVRRFFPDIHDKLGHGMYLWGMEAFSNPESVNQTVAIWRDWDLRQNSFLKSIRHLDIPVLRQIGLLPLLVRLLNPVTQGLAIQRANTYTYRTAGYMLSTAQQHHPGRFADQQHVWQATVGRGISVFTTHPGAPFKGESSRNTTPSYWVGNGIFPHAHQYRNVSLITYDLRMRKGFMEPPRQFFTHAWFPQSDFDEVIALRPDAFAARSEDGFIALFGTEPFEVRDSELIQHGRVTSWAVVLGSVEELDWNTFVAQTRTTELKLNGKRLILKHADHEYILTYRRDFTADGVPQPTEHPRLDSPYGSVPREPDSYRLRFADEDEWVLRL